MFRINKELQKDIFNKVFQNLKGFEGLYKISKNGEIWSCHYNKLLIPHINKDGYLKVPLVQNSIRTNNSIHRLLALQFISNPDNKPEVDHIDRNKMNNSLSNLRWVTRIENRRNRPDIITDIEAWKLARKVYHQDWHKKMYPIKQQILGITPRGEMTKTKQPNYERDLMRKYRATFSEEKKESIKSKARDKYNNSGGKERQTQYLQNEEVHNKRMEQQRLKRASLTQEQKDAAAKRRKEIYDAKKKLI